MLDSRLDFLAGAHKTTRHDLEGSFLSLQAIGVNPNEGGWIKNTGAEAGPESSWYMLEVLEEF